jgi:hypothetical protein
LLNPRTDLATRHNDNSSVLGLSLDCEASLRSHHGDDTDDVDSDAEALR